MWTLLELVTKKENYFCATDTYTNKSRREKTLEYRHKCAITSTNSWQYIVRKLFWEAEYRLVLSMDTAAYLP